MAGMLVVAGALVVAGQSIGRPLLAIAFGMTLYSVVTSSGYFAQRRVVPPLVMFAALFTLLAIASAALLTLER